MVSILRRKVWRDLRRQWPQFAAVALTIGLGLAGFVAARDAYLNLNGSVDQVYARLRFADVTITGGDTGAVRVAAATLPGQPVVETRVQADVPLRIGSTKLLGRMVSLPADGSQPLVNRLDIRAGELTTGGIAVEHHLADHYGLSPGDTITFGTADGWKTLPISAVVTSPEYLWPARSRQEIVTDPAQFGVVFAPEPVVRGLAGDGAQAQVSLFATQRAQATDLVRDGYALASRAGATEVVDGTTQPSARAIDDDIAAISDYAVLFPLLFVTAAVLAAYILLGRLVAGQREIIGTLRASGVSAGTIARHYLGHAFVTAAAGVALGIGLGLPLGGWFATAYASAIGLPFAVAGFHPASILWAAVVGIAASAVAAWTPARAAVRTSPAEAMRTTPATDSPASPAIRLLPSRTPMRWRMVVRGLGRNRRRSLFTLAGITLALSLVIVPIGLWDTLQLLLPRQFTVVQREDLQLYPAPGQLSQVLAATRANADVAAAEPFARSDVTIAGNGRSHPTVLYAYTPGTQMHGFPDGLPAGGIVLPAVLRDSMKLSVGDRVTITFSGQAAQQVTVSAFVEEVMGAIAYSSLDQFTAWTGGATADGVAVKLRGSADPSAASLLSEQPGVVAAVNIRGLQNAMTDSFSLYTTLVIIMATIGAAMAAALIYTTTSANIAERRVELGTLRAAGMSAGLLARLLAVENLLLAVAGLVPGLLAGWLLARYFMTAYQTDQMHFSLQLRPATLPLIAAGIIVAAALAQLPAQHQIRRTDIAQVVRERSS